MEEYVKNAKIAILQRITTAVKDKSAKISFTDLEAITRVVIALSYNNTSKYYDLIKQVEGGSENG